MSDKTIPLDLIPGYISPLTDKEHARIGRIAVLWGQVEYFLDGLLPHVSGISWDDLAIIGVAERNVHAKTAFLKSVSRLLHDEEVRQNVRAFCETIDNTKVARNHLFHGMWGLRANSKTQTVEASARHVKTPSKPLKIADLARLEKDLCRCSRMGMNLLQGFWGWSETGAARFLHGSDRDIPKWLQQWSERNPPNDDNLDPHAKAGQLPRLARPYPRK